jgi:hypothetical protein
MADDPFVEMRKATHEAPPQIALFAAEARKVKQFRYVPDG